MKKTYRSIDDVFRSPRAEFTVRTAKADPTDRVLRSTKLEDSIYADLRSGDDALAQTEQDAAKKLRSFPALSRDIYQSLVDTRRPVPIRQKLHRVRPVHRLPVPVHRVPVYRPKQRHRHHEQ